jgi:hypothetical protein
MLRNTAVRGSASEPQNTPRQRGLPVSIPSSIALQSSYGPGPPLLSPIRSPVMRHTVGLPGWVISTSQGLYVHRTTQHAQNKDKHPCPKRNSNPRSSVLELKAHVATGPALFNAADWYNSVHLSVTIVEVIKRGTTNVLGLINFMKFNESTTNSLLTWWNSCMQGFLFWIFRIIGVNVFLALRIQVKSLYT